MQGLQNNDSQTNVESDQGPAVRQSGAREKTNAASRRKWSKDDNILLWKCYLKSKPNDKGYRKRFYKIWLDDGGFPVSEQRICDQVRQIEKKEWLTKVEREMLQRSLLQIEEQGNNINCVDIVEDQSATDLNLIPSQVVTVLNVEPDDDVRNDDRVRVPPVEIEPEIPTIESEPDLGDVEIAPEDLVVLNRLRELVDSEVRPIFNLKSFNRKEVIAKTTIVNRLLKHFKPTSITESRNLFQAASLLVGELVGAKTSTPKKNKEPWWKRRIEKDRGGSRQGSVGSKPQSYFQFNV